MAEVNRLQRQRILVLMQKENDHNGLLSPAERDELLELQVLAGLRLDAPLHLVNQWAAGTLDTLEPSMTRGMKYGERQRNPRRPMSGRQAVAATLGMRWPRKPLSGRQAQLETLKHRWPTWRS